MAQINALITDATLIDTTDTRLSDARPASDVSAWAKASTKPSYTYSEVGAAASSHTHNYAGSSSAGGAATSADKLNTNAGSVTQPVYFANGVPVATTYSLGKSVPSNAVFTDTTYSNMVGATTSVAGTAGLVPAPSAGAATRYLRSDGTWQVPPDTNTTYSANNGVSLTGTTFSNSGVRSITTGGTNGTISVNTNGTSANVAVKGLGTAAYTASTDYATSGHTHNYAGSSSAGGSATTAEKVNGALTITLNGGTTEGTDKFTYDGSAGKTVDISGGGDDRFYFEENSSITYYVSPTGSDSNTGISADSPFLTINKAIQEGCKRGVNLHPGNGVKIGIAVYGGTYPESVQVSGANTTVMIFGADSNNIRINQVYCRGGKAIFATAGRTLEIRYGFTASDNGLISVEGNCNYVGTDMFGKMFEATQGGVINWVNASVMTLTNTANYFQPFQATRGGTISLYGTPTVPAGSKVDKAFLAEGGLIFINGLTNNGTVTTMYSTSKGGRIFNGAQTSAPNY